MSKPYNEANAREFYARIKSLSNTECLPTILFNSPDDIKLSKKITGLPFSLIALSNSSGTGENYYMISDMHVGEPGGYGHIKVVYPICLYENAVVVNFYCPLALKICPQNEEKDPHTVSTDTDIFMKEMFVENYSYGTVRAHPTKEGVKTKLYYTFPLYHGQDLLSYLNSFITRNARLDAGAMLNIFQHLAEKVKKVHEKNCIHLDIKLENIICYVNPKTLELNIRLIDWDFLVKFHTPILPKGTRGYMAPEIDYLTDPSLDKWHTALPSLDIFSLGKTFEEITEVCELSSDQKIYIRERLLNGMLAKNPILRIDINEVIERLKGIITPAIKKYTSRGTIEQSRLLNKEENLYICFRRKPPFVPPSGKSFADFAAAQLASKASKNYPSEQLLPQTMRTVC